MSARPAPAGADSSDGYHGSSATPSWGHFGRPLTHGACSPERGEARGMPRSEGAQTLATQRRIGLSPLLLRDAREGSGP